MYTSYVGILSKELQKKDGAPNMLKCFGGMVPGFNDGMADHTSLEAAGSPENWREV